MRVFIALAAYNEATEIGSVIDDLHVHGYRDIVVCSDGSTDETAEISYRKGAITLEHPINRGAGAASKTAIDAALSQGADAIVLMDADGQHAASDVQKLVTALNEQKVDIAIGDRMRNNSNMPFIRRIFNTIAGLITRALGGAAIRDTQSGFKAFTSAAARTIRIRSNDFEFCSEIVREIRYHKLSFAEIPIQVIYSDYSQSKGQSFYRGIRTAWRLFVRSIS